MKNSRYIILILTVLLSACKQTTQPKPYAYFRITLPEHQYSKTDTLGPYSTELSKYCIAGKTDNKFSTDTDEWFDLYYPTMNATIHLSYKKISHRQLRQITEESRDLAYKHTIRADAITESFFANDSAKIYCILYKMTGNAASQAQFFATDSVRNFLRGALYFNHTPNADSIAPVAEYVQQDMIHLIETLNWKNK